MKTRDYSYFLTRIAGLMGMSADDLQTDEQANLNGFFNRAIRDGWERTNWPDLCPYGEARFVGNVLPAPAPNGFGTMSFNGNSLTANATTNPFDERTNAGLLREDSSSAQKNCYIISDVTPATEYVFTAYVKPAGRDYCYLLFMNSSVAAAGFYLSGSGSVVVQDAGTATITLVGNGFYQCSIRGTVGQNTSGGAYVYISSDGTYAGTTYTGNNFYGIYLWGFNMVLATPVSSVLPWSQVGENDIETIFNAWQSRPYNLQLPIQARYSPTPGGIYFYSNAGTVWYPWTPTLQNMTQTVYPTMVFIYYRRECPEFLGDDYDAAATYAVDDQVYFTDSDDVGNYYKCIVATTAGQSPETTATSWELLEIPQFLFDFIVYKSYSDWLLVEGQHQKAIVQSKMAEDIIDGEFDKMERQQGWTLQTKMQTHLTSQPN